MSDQPPPIPPPEPGEGSPHQPPPGPQPSGQPPTASYGSPPPLRRRRLPGGAWPWAIAAALVLIVAATVLVVALGGGEEEAKAQTVRFQEAIDVGPDPFLEKPAERRGKRKVKITPSSPDVGSGPFGGTGSDLVCDRDLLIESLKARPDRLVEWARVLGVEPTIKAVGTYISKLHPVTLTRDTRITNHSFVNGRAVGFQAILAAGTAVLVDDYGNPVVRCRCGNPLLKPVHVPTAVCLACPPRYEPPPPCPYTEEVTYRRRWYPDKWYSNRQYDEIFIRRFRSDCYRPYPDPPHVTITDIYDPDLKPRPKPKPRPTRTPTAAPQAAPPSQQTNPSASFTPSSGPVCRSYTLNASEFRGNRTLSITLARPDGVNESYSMITGAAGAAHYTFHPGPNCANDAQGIYTATVRDPSTGDSAQASVGVSGGGDSGGGGGGGGGGESDELQCDPPRSQLEFEQCRDAGRLAPP